MAKGSGARSLSMAWSLTHPALRCLLGATEEDCCCRLWSRRGSEVIQAAAIFFCFVLKPLDKPSTINRAINVGQLATISKESHMTNPDSKVARWNALIGGW